MKNFDWFGYDEKYLITHPLILVREVSYEIKYGFQRMFRGYDDRVSWSLDNFLAENIPKWLKIIKDRKGIPLLITQEEDFDKTGNFKTGIEDKRRKEYQEILDDIIAGFEAYLLMEEVYGDEDLYQRCIEKFDKGMRLFVKYYNTFWW